MIKRNQFSRTVLIEDIQVPGWMVGQLRQHCILDQGGKLGKGVTAEMLMTAVNYMNGGLKLKLNDAFRALRAKRFTARQRFRCCSSCAGYQIAEEATTRRAEGLTDWRGVVYYTLQDAEGLERGDVYLRFGDIETTKHGVIGIGSVKVGVETCKALSDVGLHWEWDGDEHTAIRVRYPVPAQAKKEAA